MSIASVTCRRCLTVVWEGGAVSGGEVTEIPHSDGQALLSDFADSSCPIGGLAFGCPNVTPAVQEELDRTPHRLREFIQAIQLRLPRTRRLPLQAMTAGSGAEVVVTWQQPMLDDTYSVAVSVVAPAALVGQIRVAVKPGSLTAEGCSLLVRAEAAVPVNTAGLHVAGLP